VQYCASISAIAKLLLQLHYYIVTTTTTTTTTAAAAAAAAAAAVTTTARSNDYIYVQWLLLCLQEKDTCKDKIQTTTEREYG